LGLSDGEGGVGVGVEDSAMVGGTCEVQLRRHEYAVSKVLAGESKMI
jgi:hypothetical protein